MSEHWVTTLFKHFERILRWFYPGILLLILFPLSRQDILDELNTAYGFLDNTIWLLLISSFGFGAVVYIIQSNIITQILSSPAEWTNWDVAMDKDNDPDAVTNRPKKNPVWWLCWCVHFFDKQAGEIERKRNRDKNNSIMDYQWGVYHATSITGWLLLIMILISEETSTLHKIDNWPYYWIPIVVLVSSIYLFARLCRVRR